MAAKSLVQRINKRPNFAAFNDITILLPFEDLRDVAMGAAMQRGLVLLLVGSFLGGSCGCQKSGGETLPVAGRVTFNHQPVPQGRIVMWPVDEKDRPDSGTIVDGVFDFEARAGSKRVEIHAERTGQPDPELNMPSRVQYIPAKYNSQSKLTVDISPTNDNHFDFELTD